MMLLAWGAVGLGLLQGWVLFDQHVLSRFIADQLGLLIVGRPTRRRSHRHGLPWWERWLSGLLYLIATILSVLFIIVLPALGLAVLARACALDLGVRTVLTRAWVASLVAGFFLLRAVREFLVYRRVRQRREKYSL